ncbi:nonribosomal peptide synthetase MxaA [Ancylobacter amanitiformis]|uniref:MxaA protein n=1 Tax=Ancylobacter amanitiformis TaxID=217069 RepID=A0ABU0LS98_9HYPH|nr:nonribosomal peptide synthetase MxaA [Ancylobacter amanitiformis]MDQ0511530.1 mxaA protein [Ancylobacter amanitiformis]
MRAPPRLPAGLLLLLAPLFAGAAAQAQVRAVDLYAPRPFGYTIGDTIELSAEIALDAPFRLDPASLPRPRALSYWLDLRDVRLDDRGVADGVQRYTLHLAYQTFYAPLEPKRLDLPALPLTAADGGRRIELSVPSWSFLMSPLREIVASAGGTTMALRPDMAPPRIATAGTLRHLGVALIGALLALLLLAWHLGWGPLGRRRTRPFARAARAVTAELAPSTSSPPAYGRALVALHRAFDATAGAGVFAEDLPGFFAAHPAFAPVEGEVRRLFAASRRLFFGEDPAAAARELAPEDVLALARRLRAVERGSA